MRNPGDEFNQKWREANERARRAEEKLQQPWAAFAAGKACAPPDELLRDVARLRRECDFELSQLLANIQISRKGDGLPK